MIRRHLNTGQGEEEFAWRGGEVSRIEGLTDGVFAIALTLLVVSLEVPATWAELKAAFVQIPVFLVCFALLYYIWYSHYLFHRRFGLEDRPTIWLNSMLIFLVLFYVYPLKFLAQALYSIIRYGSPVQLDDVGNPILDPSDPTGATYLNSMEKYEMPELMIIYNIGYIGIFLVLGLGTWHAWRQRELLGLNNVEQLITRAAIREQLIMVGFGVASLLIVLINGAWAPISGMIYALVGPIQGFHGYYVAKSVAAAQKDLPKTVNK